jgi:hypothetical protein
LATVCETVSALMPTMRRCSSCSAVSGAQLLSALGAIVLFRCVMCDFLLPPSRSLFSLAIESLGRDVATVYFWVGLSLSRSLSSKKMSRVWGSCLRFHWPMSFNPGFMTGRLRRQASGAASTTTSDLLTTTSPLRPLLPPAAAGSNV